MSRLSISNETTVVAYDDGNNLFAGRLWWGPKYSGHPRVRVLDGGWDLWLAEHRPMNMVNMDPLAVRFEAHRDDASIPDSA